jgi:L-threonylcarbamoyladenylate synthase
VTGSVVEEAVAAARRGGLVVLPTDTVYGVGTRPDDPEATARLFAAKERPVGLTLPVLAASLDDARRVGVFDRRAEALAEGCWPGAVTLVLGGDRATVGVRIPAHLLALEVLRATGPLAVTSANRSGEPPATTCEQLLAVFGDQVDVYLCEERPLQGVASTVLDLAHGEPRLLRRGDADPGRLAGLMGWEGPLLDSGAP